MSDALSDIAKRDSAIEEYNKAIAILANRINKQTKWIKNRESWEIEVTEKVLFILEDMMKEIEKNRGEPCP